MERADEATGVTGAHTTGGIPHGSTSLTPFVALVDAGRAVTWYADVLGARVVSVTDVGGVVVHAELDLGRGRLQVGEVNPAYDLVAAPRDGDCYSLGLYCGDADALVERAVAHGAEVREPLATFVSGDRYASVRDPFGVRWSIMTRVEDLSEDESARRVAAWAAAQSPPA